MRHGKFRLVPNDTDVRKLTEDLIEVFKIPAQGRETILTANISESVPSSLFIDSNRIQQVLINLVSNALKFTLRGNIYVSFSYDESTCVLSGNVKDTGVGIKKED